MSQGLFDKEADEKHESRKKSKKNEETEVYIKSSNSQERKLAKERRKELLQKEEVSEKF